MVRASAEARHVIRELARDCAATARCDGRLVGGRWRWRRGWPNENSAGRNADVHPAANSVVAPGAIGAARRGWHAMT
jgi:hypothetical protein